METKYKYRFWNGKQWGEWQIFPFYLQQTFEFNNVTYERKGIDE